MFKCLTYFFKKIFMPKINTYPIVTPQGSDKIVITQANSTPENATKNITVDSLKAYTGYTGVIPTPEMYALKNTVSAAETKTKLCISVPNMSNETWMNQSPRLFMFRFSKNKYYSDVNGDKLKRKTFVHPSHQRGERMELDFPGTNWGAGNQTYSRGIDTEWDFNSDLKFAGTQDLITDFSKVRSTAYVEVPFNKLQFLVDNNNPLTELTNFPVTTSDLSLRCANGSSLALARAFNIHNNSLTPSNIRGVRVSYKVLMRFAIGVVNPSWTNTNHQKPYIIGGMSDSVNLVYQTDTEGTPGTNNIVKYQIAIGDNASISRVITQN